MSGQEGKEESGVKSPADTRLHILSVASDLMTEKGIKEIVDLIMRISH